MTNKVPKILVKFIRIVLVFVLTISNQYSFSQISNLRLRTFLIYNVINNFHLVILEVVSKILIFGSMYIYFEICLYCCFLYSINDRLYSINQIYFKCYCCTNCFKCKKQKILRSKTK